MARFIVIHGVTQATQDQIFESARAVVASLAPGAEWLNSWWVPATEKVICEWEAPDVNAIHASLGSAGDVLPIETIHEVQWVDPKWYK